MRGVDLNRFDFDYDLTWVGFFMNSEGKVYGRFGGRDGVDADQHLTLTGLKQAMRQALENYRADPAAKPELMHKPIKRAEDFPAAGRLKTGACIHCHQVYDFERERLLKIGAWEKEMVWVYPPPRNLGLTLDPNDQAIVQAVAPGSAAARTGLQPGDRLRSLNGRPVASFADVQYALHRAGQATSLPVTWERGARKQSGSVELRPGWRTSDISWRTSMWGIPPVAAVHGKDLTPEEKQALGLKPEALAFKQGGFVPKPAARAGILTGDIILGLDDRELNMSMLQFNAYIRLNFEPGDRVNYQIIRDGRRLSIPIVLQAREP